MSDTTLPRQLQQEAFDLEDDVLPEVRSAALSQPNVAKSKVIHVRISEHDERELAAAATALNVPVSAVIRSAILRFLHEHGGNREVEYLLRALHDSGLHLVHTNT